MTSPEVIVPQLIFNVLRTSTRYRSAKVSAAVIRAPNKSAARSVESAIISSLKKNGFDIEHGDDEKHQLFGSRQ